MVTCTACGRENPAGNRFCGGCGEGLGGAACPSCGSRNAPEDRYCGACGKALSGAPPRTAAPAEERKVATVLFADVVGFTSMAEDADPELVAHTVDSAFRTLAAIVAEHGGTVDKFMGDCLMAVFGVPQAHDDDAERAIAAALAMCESAGDLRLSIGVNTGEVLVGAVGRDGDVTVIGDAVNVAARLEKAAAPGQVLVGPLTADLAPRAVLRPRDSLLLKGKREPVRVFEAISVDGEAASPGAAPPLTGRDEELDFLLTRWRRCTADQRPVVVRVTGEAGVGKTRLVDALVAAVTEQALVARLSYPAYGGLAGSRVAADLVARLGPVEDTALHDRLLSLSGVEVPSLRHLDPAAVAEEQRWAARRLLEMRAAERPLLLVLDDVHNAREPAMDLLADVLGRLRGAPVMVVVAGRPDPPAWMRRLETATLLSLEPLGRAAAAELLAGLAPSVPPLTAAAVLDRAGGNPLHLRELVRLVETSSAHSADTLPPTLHAVLAARLDGLGDEQKAAVQRAAVLGEAATAPRLSTLGASPAAVARLVQAGVLVEEDGRLRVADPLLREVAYEALPRGARGELHRLAALDADSLEERARHLDMAAGWLPGDPALAAQAAAALAEAGRALVAAFRQPEGVRLMERARERGGADPALLVDLGEALVQVVRGEDAVRLLEAVPDQGGDGVLDARRVQALANARALLDPVASLELFDVAARRWAAVGDRGKEAWTLCNKMVALLFAGRSADAAVAGERAVDLFTEIDDRAGAIATRSFLALVRPEDPRAEAWLEEALADAETCGDPTRRRNALLGLCWHTAIDARLGGPGAVARPRALCRQLATLGDDLGDAHTRVQALALEAHLARSVGDLAAASRLSAEALLAGAAAPPDPLVAAAQSVTLLAGDPQAALPPNDWARRAAGDPVAAIAAHLEAEALVLAGRPEEALERLRGIGSDVDYTAVTVGVGGVVRGWALLDAGHAGEAVEVLRPVVEAAGALHMPPTRAAAEALLAQALGESEPLPAVEDDLEGGVAAALVQRTRAARGDGRAAAALAGEAMRLAAPGLAPAARRSHSLSA